MRDASDFALDLVSGYCAAIHSAAGPVEPDRACVEG
jgi:hypothetical protein